MIRSVTVLALLWSPVAYAEDYVVTSRLPQDYTVTNKTASGNCPCPTGTCTCTKETCKCVACNTHTANVPTKSAVYVTVPALDGSSTSGGSGVVVWAEMNASLVLTNKHVVNGGRESKMTVTHGEKTYPCKFLGWSDEGDVALLQVDVELPVSPMADADPAVGTVVTHYGHSTGPKTGRIVAYQSVTVPGLSWSGREIQSDYESDSGDSGAGVYTADGKLVGVHWGGLTGRKSAAPIGVVRRLLGRFAANRFPRLAERLGPDVLVVPVEPVQAPPSIQLTPTQTGVRYYVLPGVGNCPNGQCPVQTRTR